MFAIDQYALQVWRVPLGQCIVSSFTMVSATKAENATPVHAALETPRQAHGLLLCRAEAMVHLRTSSWPLCVLPTKRMRSQWLWFAPWQVL
jgi:hypothetical protein